MTLKQLGYSALYMLFLVVMIIGFVWYQYTQMYVQDSKTTATTGIVWQKTLNLKEYKRVSNGNDLWGKYDRYTRSDRHSDAITVYCKEYCSK